ncbi:mercury(II) reductase [Geomesophilobacter sediminis]|uniref:Mercuric reductase n=1 Tax=Geomesophilobacter sediminis TaxID=2798584 RepID=A0A8J7M138_9BACT|nr:mercury(II) reductase [Geomesophilobacter sediminis]MBJ6726588.1 mercury(II) reductase [Geomesophilobacter sediminis]
MIAEQEIIIVGSGSTAFAAALRAQALGARSLMIEKSVLGGTCINWGCIPSKTLIHAALFRRMAELGERLGLGTSAGELQFSRLDAHKNGVVQELRQTKYLDVLRKVPGLTLMKGNATFIGPDTIQIGDQVLQGEHILIASGGFPRVPPIPGLERISYLTSKSALLLKEIPSSITVVGGGVIALELGQMFSRLGVRVTILEHGPRILPAVEEEPAQALREALEAEGMEIFVNTAVCSVSEEDGLTRVFAEVAGEPRTFFAEKLLLAVGTAPATADIGLERAGVEVDGRGFIKVDDGMRTTAPKIWAAGDCVVGGMQIATVGAREGILAVDNMISGCGCKIDHHTIPMAIFTDPEVAMVGYREQEAKQAGFDVICHTIDAATIPKAHVTGDLRGAIKIVADKATGKILGVHLSTHRGADVINEAALAVRFGMTVADLADTVHVYPSIGEGLRLCAQAFRRDLERLSCCAE